MVSTTYQYRIFRGDDLFIHKEQTQNDSTCNMCCIFCWCISIELFLTQSTGWKKMIEVKFLFTKEHLKFDKTGSMKGFCACTVWMNDIEKVEVS